jgi:hypothetical protein
MSSSPGPADRRFRLVWFFFGLIFATALGISACLLVRASGQGWADALIAGGVGFAGALSLALLVINFWQR